MGGVFSSISVDKTFQGCKAMLTYWTGFAHGPSADVQCLSKKTCGIKAENGRLRADIAALSASHWEADVEALPSKFHDILSTEVNTMNSKSKALSIKVDNDFNNTPPAINRGLSIGLSLGLSIPLTIAVVFLFVIWMDSSQNYIKIHNAIRRKTLTEKVYNNFQALSFKKKQFIPEIYVMNNTPTK
ncbi:hypothetical protein N7463_001441 [Penicillium fimorum]|uniref:Uncharacterized protein n=1 Tax=Penicillium fimorum TaxID=1882269 RepID=A0A9W9Y8S7_9EURO|nr:hypothetical protein N7463_001441 [Penicillium fimorum]